MTRTWNDLILTIYFLVGALFSGSSAILYLSWPSGVAKYFGGVPSPTTDTWIPIVAAGDALCSFLLFRAIWSSAEVKKLVIQGLAFFMVVHIGAFVRGEIVNGGQPKEMLVLYSLMVLTSLAGLFWWTVYNPLVDNTKAKKETADGQKLDWELLNDGTIAVL